MTHDVPKTHRRQKLRIVAKRLRNSPLTWDVRWSLSSYGIVWYSVRSCFRFIDVHACVQWSTVAWPWRERRSSLEFAPYDCRLDAFLILHCTNFVNSLYYFDDCRYAPNFDCIFLAVRISCFNNPVVGSSRRYAVLNQTWSFNWHSPVC